MMAYQLMYVYHIFPSAAAFKFTSIPYSRICSYYKVPNKITYVCPYTGIVSIIVKLYLKSFKKIIFTLASLNKYIDF